MNPLSITASFIAILQLSTKILGYLNSVKGASDDGARCVSELLNICNLLYQLRDHLEKGDTTQLWYTAVQSLAIKDGPLDQFKQALELLQDKLTDGGRLRKRDTLLWSLKKKEIDSVFNRIERLKTLVETALTLDQFKLSQAIKKDVNFVRIQIPAMQSGVDQILDQIRKDRKSAKRRAILQWISPTDYPAQQADIIKRKQEGTGEWFTDAPEWAKWLQEPKATLLCPGIPGAGKTMTTAIAIDHLLKKAQNSSNGLAYVYFNYKTQDVQDASSMLAAILKQLIQARPLIAEPVKRLYKQHGNRSFGQSIEEILVALGNVLAEHNTVHIVIDALDECRTDNRNQLLARLRDLQASHDIRLMATSRFIPDIVAGFGESLRLEVRASLEDVKRFVAGQIYRLPHCIRRDSELQDMVKEKILETSDGMFLLARLHTDSLLDKRTTKAVKTTLAKFSKGSDALNDAYREAFQRIESQPKGDRELAKKVLVWITFAKRLLTTAELCCALAIEPETTELDSENIPVIEDLVSVCAGLVVVDQESAAVRLVHHTTQSYFEQTGVTWIPAPQLQITEACLTSLCFDIFRSANCPNWKEFEDRLEKNKLLGYAAKHWVKHAREVKGEAYDQAVKLLHHQKLLDSAMQSLGEMPIDYAGNGLHYAARFGLFQITQELLRAPPKGAIYTTDTRDSLNRTPLEIAAIHGHAEVAKVLVDHGADVNAREDDEQTAIHMASMFGRTQIIQLLLEYGAKINIQDGYGWTALHLASRKGNEDVVQLLLHHGANFNVQDELGRTTLHTALLFGHTNVVKLLLHHGANIDIQDKNSQNALYMASEIGNESIIQLLLSHGANINKQDEYGWTALFKALERGNKNVVQLMLDHGANLDIQNKSGCTALYMASTYGQESVVKLLLEYGANIDIQDKSGRTALYTASGKGHENVVQLLLNRGAKIDIQDENRWTALYTASGKGHKNVVQLLLNCGANIDIQDEYGWTVLYTPSGKGHKDVVKLLLDRGVNINNQDKYGATALYFASSYGHMDIAKLLLDHDADVNLKFRRNGYYDNALQVASRNGHDEIVELLREHGAKDLSLSEDRISWFS